MPGEGAPSLVTGQKAREESRREAPLIFATHVVCGDTPGIPFLGGSRGKPEGAISICCLIGGIFLGVGR